jgi:hypothetical protein
MEHRNGAGGLDNGRKYLSHRGPAWAGRRMLDGGGRAMVGVDEGAV